MLCLGFGAWNLEFPPVLKGRCENSPPIHWRETDGVPEIARAEGTVDISGGFKTAGSAVPLPPD